jgi:hypothetical protein
MHDHSFSNIRVDASYIGSKMARILVPKIHINEKINITMAKKMLKTNVEWAICGD